MKIINKTQLIQLLFTKTINLKTKERKMWGNGLLLLYQYKKECFVFDGFRIFLINEYEKKTKTKI